MWLDAGVMQPDIVWTAAKGVYARPIAEHILALILAAARGLPERARARSWGTAEAASLPARRSASSDRVESEPS